MKTVKWTLCSMIVCAVIVTFQMTALAADTDALVVDETGNVGIGTDTPQQKLDVNGLAKIGDLLIGPWPAGSNYVFFGNAQLDQSISENYAILQMNTGRTYINSPTDIRVRINNQDKLAINNSGNLGIGTIQPTAALDISANTTPIRFYRAGGAGAGFLTIDNRMTGSNSDMVYQPDSDGSGAGGHAFYVDNGSSISYAMGIDKNGNVGIGTTSPGAKLHINGSVRGHHDGALMIDTGSGYVLVGPRDATMVHFNTDREKYFFDKEIRVDGGSIGSYNENLNLRTSGTNRITVLASNGNVGIGTTSPSEKLHVAGGLYTDGSINCYEITTRYAGGGGGADFVFKEDYNLPALSDVRAFIQKNKHLPEIPSAAEMQANGVSVPEMLTKHLQKIEELTLYMIELKSDNTKLQSENGDLRELVQRLEDRLSKLETQAKDIDKINN